MSRGAALTAPVTTAVPANGFATAQSTGIQITLPEQGAIRIIKYMTDIVDPNGSTAVFAVAGQFGIEIPPYGIIHAVEVLPLMSEFAINDSSPSGPTTARIPGQFLPNGPALISMIVDHWFQYDDVPDGNGVQTAIQLHSAWEAFTISGSAQQVTVNERCTYEIWQLQRDLRRGRQ